MEATKPDTPPTESPVTVLAKLAADAASTTLPAEVTDRALRVVVDTLAVAIAGSEDEFCAHHIDDLVRTAGDGPASVVRGARRVPAATAAYVNALPTTVLQIDEGHRESRGHPGIHLVPAAVAVAEEVGASGADLVRAVVAGYEVSARIGLMLGGMQGELHPHGNWGTFGAAVSAATLLGADGDQIADCVEAVATLPISPWRGTVATGRTLHHVYAALGAQTGVMLARAVMSGGTVEPGAFEQFFVPTFATRPRDWNHEGYAILHNYFKYQAACAHLHTTIQAVERLRPELGGVQEIAGIDVFTYAAAADLSTAQPANNLAARFSIPFLVGRILAHGTVGVGVCTAAELADEATAGIAARVSVHVDPECDRRYPAERPARVVVRLRDGRELAADEAMQHGDYAHPATDEEWSEKLAALLGRERAARLSGFVGADPEQWSAADLGRAMSA